MDFCNFPTRRAQSEVKQYTNHDFHSCSLDLQLYLVSQPMWKPLQKWRIPDWICLLQCVSRIVNHTVTSTAPLTRCLCAVILRPRKWPIGFQPTYCVQLLINLYHSPRSPKWAKLTAHTWEADASNKFYLFRCLFITIKGTWHRQVPPPTLNPPSSHFPLPHIWFLNN